MVVLGLVEESFDNCSHLAGVVVFEHALKINLEIRATIVDEHHCLNDGGVVRDDALSTDLIQVIVAVHHDARHLDRAPRVLDRLDHDIWLTRLTCSRNTPRRTTSVIEQPTRHDRPEFHRAIRILNSRVRVASNIPQVLIIARH